MASDTPNPKSYDQLLGEMLSSYMSRIGVSDVNVGSANTSFFEVVALAVARAGGDVLSVLRDYSVDRATGEALRRLARDERLTPFPARVATGTVTITDSSFQKLSSKVYAGTRAPNAGSSLVNVSDTEGWPASGQIYIGRGTPNVEGPLSYSAINAVGGYFQITLISPTNKFHNIGESVVVAQGGNRPVPSNAVVRVPASGAEEETRFYTVSTSVILDGETEVTEVKVSAQEPGARSSVPRGAIKEFVSLPFAGATVSNENKYTTGRDAETDEELRERIKRARLSKGLGTATAIKAAVIGATSPDEQATVVSDEIVSDADSATLFVDDGNVYEEKSKGVGLELIVESALGGEKLFQLATSGRQTSIAKAFLESTIEGPFDVVGGDRLAISVGGVTYEHSFSNSDFAAPGGATAYELSASINANSDLGFEAVTSGGGKRLVVQAKAEEFDYLQIALPTFGRDVSRLVSFPSNEQQTLRLYKNKQPLSKDGREAAVFSEEQADWSPSIADGDTLILLIDGTAAITYTILNADFIAEGTHTSVNATNTLESWTNVLNSKLTGITVSIVGEQIKVRSNLGPSNRARVEVDASSTLVTKGMFSSNKGLVSEGKKSDFSLSRNTAQFRLVDPLVAGDELTSGTEQTEGRVQGSSILGGTVTLLSDGYIWLLADSPDAQIINTGAVAATTFSVTKMGGNVVRYQTTAPNAFINVEDGDYLIVWSAEFNADNRLEGRVAGHGTDYVDIEVTAAEYALASNQALVAFVEGIAVLRSDLAPQKFKVAGGARTVSSISLELQDQSDSMTFSVVDDEMIVAATNTKDPLLGSMLVVTSDSSGKLVGLSAGQTGLSQGSLVGNESSQSKEGDFPLFIHSKIVAPGAYADPPNSYIPSVDTDEDLDAFGIDPNELIVGLHRYTSPSDAQPAGESDQIASLAGTAVGISPDRLIRRLREDDRVYAAAALDFGHDDTIVVILDGDASGKTFEVPLFRVAVANTTAAVSPTQFNAYDTELGPTSSFVTSFGAAYDFSGHKALMKARKVLDQSQAQDAILYHSARYGRTGNRTNVGYTYPTAANSPITSTVLVADKITIRIATRSGNPVATSIDASTEWNVTVTPNTPVAGVDQVTYTYSGTGTAPALGSLSGGEYVTITGETEFSEENTGTFRVSDEPGFTPTATSFSVVRKNGDAVTESDKATLVADAIRFYEADPTAATDIVDYVNSSLSDYLSAALVDDSGTSGVGVIEKSTAEDSDFAYDGVDLLDGVNWIESSDLGSSPQFVFKRPLDLPTDLGYEFRDGEEVRIVPCTHEQVMRFMNVLAVSGITTLADAQLAYRDSQLLLATKVVGGNGSVQVVGGNGSFSRAAALGAGSRLDNALAKMSISRQSQGGLHSDEWIRVYADGRQAKSAEISSNTSATILPNLPVAGKSIVKLLNRASQQRYFGKPRHHVRTRGRDFRVEKQGRFVCISWAGTLASPGFLKSSVELDDSAGGTLNVNKITGSSDAEYIILTGNANFTEVSIGDLITVANMSDDGNNGTFLVTGVSEDGTSVRVLNSDAVNSYSSGTFTITDNTDLSGDDFIVDGNTLTADTDFPVGATDVDTAANLAASIGALPGVSASSFGNVVTIVADSPSASVAISYMNNAGAAGATASGAFLVGESFSAGDFSAYTEVSEGDQVLVDEPFHVLNRGKFRVIRRFEDSIYLDNLNAVEETVLLPDNFISLGYDGTTSFDVDGTDNSLKLLWNGTGTEPDFGAARPGDVLRLGTDFLVANRGEFMVLESGAKQQEVTEVTAPTGSQISGGQYFLINSAGDAVEYYVWFKVDGAGADPAVVGKTGVLVNVNSTDTADAVALQIKNEIDVLADLDATVAGNVVIVTTTGFDETTDASNFNVGGSFAAVVTQQGRRTFVRAINPKAASESGVLITDDLDLHRPALGFWEYEAATAGDSLILSGTALPALALGTWTIDEVLFRDMAVVNGALAAAFEVPLAGQESSVVVQEENAYEGYKKILLIAIEPGALDRTNLVLDTNAQFNKIDEAAGLAVESATKLAFDDGVSKGLDSYRHHIGMIAEANRIVYGDPRDSTTYPGTGAAGAEIFIRGPLRRRIQVSIDVRLNTGVPFAQIVEQIRNAVDALINGNPIGQPIAISRIVSVVDAIPGVRAVAITSPQYDSTHDVIRLQPSEKASVIDPTADISVSKIN